MDRAAGELDAQSRSGGGKRYRLSTLQGERSKQISEYNFLRNMPKKFKEDTLMDLEKREDEKYERYIYWDGEE